MFDVGLVAFFFILSLAFAARDPPGFEDGSDLISFVTRPDLRAPRYVVTKHHPEAVAPGYWFVAHYPTLFGAPSTWRKEHLPYQTGIHIYDNDGDLVWSGARDYRNTNSFDFKTVTIDGEDHLSFYIDGVLEDNVADEKRDHGGVTMNNRYEEVTRTNTDASLGWRSLDVHEFTILPGGQSALLSVNYPDEGDAADIGQGNRSLLTYGFQEIELGTGKSLFDWEPLRHGVSLSESIDVANMAASANETWWDWFHLNSVDKNIQGDYLISGRHTSCVYKVSGQDGQVLWRLGGKRSDFHLEEGVHFEWQHHVRWLFEDDTKTIISVFDNAGEDVGRNIEIPQLVSNGKIIQLDHTTMTASLLRSFERPDGGKTSKLGSVQSLGDGYSTSNVFINWAQSSFISEYDGQNRLVLEAKLASDRMWTYRAYKLPWVGKPSTESLVLKSKATTLDESKPAVTYYVSWNGATEVESWAFYSSDTTTGSFEKVATIPKVGFETSWTTSRIRPYSYVEGVASDGTVLGQSNVTALMISKQWKSVSITEDTKPKTEAASPENSKDGFNLASSIPYLIIDALALYALYALLKVLIPRLTKKSKGYSRLSSGPDEPILGSTQHSVP